METKTYDIIENEIENPEHIAILKSLKNGPLTTYNFYWNDVKYAEIEANSEDDCFMIALDYFADEIAMEDPDYIGACSRIVEKDSDDTDEEMVHCGWCGELVPIDGCRNEIDLGPICPQCQQAIKSRGEQLTFTEGVAADIVSRFLDRL